MDSCFTFDGFLTIQIFPLLFNLAIQEFSSKWVKVMLPYLPYHMAAYKGGWG
jgi:hypothetical protein